MESADSMFEKARMEKELLQRSQREERNRVNLQRKIEKQRKEDEAKHQLEIKDPIGKLIKYVKELMETDEFRTELLREIEKTGESEIAFYDTRNYGYPDFCRKRKIPEKIGYDGGYLISDLMEQAKTVAPTTIYFDEGPFQGWHLYFGLKKITSGPGFHAHGSFGRSSYYVYRAEICRTSSWRRLMRKIF